MSAIALDFTQIRKSKEGTLADLLAAWQMDEVEIELPSMGGFANSPSLGNKVRGAFGVALLEGASAAVRSRKRCDWPWTSTAEIFFGRRRLITLGRHSSEIAKPFVLSARRSPSGSLIVAIRIFGSARERTSAATDALIRSVRDLVRWSDLAKDENHFVPAKIEVASVSVQSGKGLVVERINPKSAELTFVTSIDAERGSVLDNPALVLERILRRVALLAPWQQVSLHDCYPALLETCAAVTVDAVDETSLPVQTTGGHRLANRLDASVSMHISGMIGPIWPALQIGEVAHVGRGASLGLGRFRLRALETDGDGDGPPAG